MQLDHHEIETGTAKMTELSIPTLTELNLRLSKLEHKILGNGEIGLLMKVDRLQQTMHSICKIGWLITAVFITQLLLTMIKNMLDT